MVKLVGPLGSHEARGRIGATVHNTWRGLHVAKATATPIKQYETAQLAARYSAAQLTNYWKTLTQLQRDSWNSYAAQHPRDDWTGTPLRWSGFNAFMWANFLAYDSSTNYQPEPPAYEAPWILPSLTSSQAWPSVILSWTYLAVSWGEDCYVDIRMQGPISFGARPRFKLAKHVAYEPYLSETWTSPTWTEGRYGLWARLFHYQLGQPTNWLTTTQDLID